MAFSLRTMLALLVMAGMFSGLVLAASFESSNDVEIYKVKVWKHGKTNDKVCWNKYCSNEFKKH